MAQPYTRFLEILKKWPVDEARTKFCFGKHLRDSSSKWFTPDGRVIGNPEVCEQRLKSLERLLADKYKQEYPAHVKTVSGMSPEECTKTLLKDFSDQGGFIKEILSKLWPGASKEKV